MKKIILVLAVIFLAGVLFPDTPPDGTIIVIDGKKFISLGGTLEPIDDDDPSLDPPPID